MFLKSSYVGIFHFPLKMNKNIAILAEKEKQCKNIMKRRNSESVPFPCIILKTKTKVLE